MGKFFSFGNSNEEENQDQDGEENDTDNTSRRQVSHSRDDEADERSSLLPQPPQYGGRPLNPGMLQIHFPSFLGEKDLFENHG